MIIIAYFTNQGNFPKYKIINTENKKKTPNQLKDNQIHIVVKMTVAFKKIKKSNRIVLLEMNVPTYIHYYLLVKSSVLSVHCNKAYIQLF